MSHKITKLFESRHVQGRWYAQLEDGEALRVSVSLIADWFLYPGRELDEEEYAGLKADAAKMSAKARAMRILGTRMMSRKELHDRLVEKGETPEDAAEAVDYLESLGFLNDGEYAASIVRHYAAKGYGVARIKQEFYRRGVPRDYWETALLEMPEDTDALDSLIQRKTRGREPDKKELKRLTELLLRRGYSWGEIREALARTDFSEDYSDE